MSTPEPNISLEQRVAELQAELDKQRSSSFGSKLRKLGRSLLAALTTPEAIKEEKYLLVVALTRAAILVPSAAVVIDFVIGALTGKFPVK